MSIHLTPKASFPDHFLSLMVQLKDAKSITDITRSEEIFLSIMTRQKNLEMSFNSSPSQSLEFEKALSLALAKAKKLSARFFSEESSPTLKLCSLAAKQNALFFGRTTSHPALECLNVEYPCSFEFGGIVYPSARHAFITQMLSQQSLLPQQCVNATEEELCNLSIEKGNNRLDWYHYSSSGKQCREDVLFHIFCAKFGQNLNLKNTLLATLHTSLIFTEDLSKMNSFWGVGNQGKGSNKIGQILMEVREHYKGIGVTPIAPEWLQKLKDISPKMPLHPLNKSDEDIKKEHHGLNTLSTQKDNPLETSVCRKAENEDKNQNHYKHYIYDKTLVSLSTGCYINANFMLANSIIGTQSPMPNTAEDFWQMILDQKCKSVVMLNDASDVTHYVYYPTHKDSPKHFDSIEVQLMEDATLKTKFSWNHSPNEEDLHGLKVRILQIKKGDTTHLLTHHQYVNWRDNGIGSEGCIGELVKTIYTQQSSEGPPVVVHCLAGIGRTATFATVYDQYCKWKNGKPLDVRKCVEEQRSPETGRHYQMLPLETQYLFCYHTLQHIVLSTLT